MVGKKKTGRPATKKKEKTVDLSEWVNFKSGTRTGGEVFNEKIRWFLEAVESFVYEHKPLPPMPEEWK